ncbi:MAG: GNAT family N-acetyltransferase, partial [Myxococcales bacterium]
APRVAARMAWRLVGLLPLYERVSRAAGVPVRRWGYLGDEWVGSDYMGVLAPRALQPYAEEQLARHLAARSHRIDLLELLDAEERSRFHDLVLEQWAGAYLGCERERRFECPVVEISGSYDGYLREVGRRDNLMRRRKWLQSQPGYGIEVCDTPVQVQRGLDDFFRLHARRWESDGGSQGIAGRDVHAFHRDVAHHLAESGRLRLYTMRLGDQPLASVYGIVQGERFYYYQSGYDPDWARRSVGLVLLGRTLEDSWGAGLKRFDFLRGSEPYKFEWANKVRHTELLRLVNRTAGGAAWLAVRDGTRGAKLAARRLVGDQIWGRLQKVRRVVRGG